MKDKMAEKEKTNSELNDTILLEQTMQYEKKIYDLESLSVLL